MGGGGKGQNIYRGGGGGSLAKEWGKRKGRIE